VLVWLPCIEKDLDSLLLYCALQKVKSKKVVLAIVIGGISSLLKTELLFCLVFKLNLVVVELENVEAMQL